MRALIGLLILSAALTAGVRADIPPPRESKPVPPPVKPVDEAAPPAIKADCVAHVGVASVGSVPLKVEIPKKVLAQLQSLEKTSAKKGSLLPPVNLFMGGIAFAFTVGLGCLWLFIRRSERTRRVLTVGAFAALGLCISTVTFADGGPGRDPNRIEYADAKLGKVIVEVSDSDNDATVILKKDDLETLLSAKKNGGGE